MRKGAYLYSTYSLTVAAMLSFRLGDGSVPDLLPKFLFLVLCVSQNRIGVFLKTIHLLGSRCMTQPLSVPLTNSCISVPRKRATANVMPIAMMAKAAGDARRDSRDAGDPEAAVFSIRLFCWAYLSCAKDVVMSSARGRSGADEMRR